MDFRTWFQKLALGVLVASSLFLAEFASAAADIKGSGARRRRTDRQIDRDPVGSECGCTQAARADQTDSEGRFEVAFSGAPG